MRGGAFAFHQRLQSVIEKNVSETVLTLGERVRNCVGELMGLTENWPFLGEDKWKHLCRPDVKNAGTIE